MPFPFVNPWMLAGLAAVALPLLFHFLARREFVVVPWGAMQLLASASDLRSRLPRKEWLLLAVRMGIVALLALAFARPWLLTRWTIGLGSPARRDVVFVLDGSASMSLGRDGTTLHQAAVEQARQSIDELSPGDTATLIDARDDLRLITPPLCRNFDRVRQALDELPLPHGPANLAQAVTQAIRVLGNAKHLDREVVVLTDGQSASLPAAKSDDWRAVNALLGLTDPAPRVSIIDINAIKPQGSSSVERTNRGLGPLWISREQTAVGLPVRIVTTLHVRGPQAQRHQIVHLEIDGQRLSAKSRRVIVEPNGDADIEFEHRFDKAGEHTLAVALDPDDSSIDNRTVDDRAARTIHVTEPVSVLLVAGDPRDEHAQSETFFAAAALGNGTNVAPWLRPAVVKWDQWQPADLLAPAVVVLANVPRMSETQAAWLDGHLARGGGLLVALGDRVDAAQYNRMLFRAGTGPLPASVQNVRKTADPLKPETLDIAGLQPPWSIFTDKTTNDLAQTQFSSWWSVTDMKRGIPIAKLYNGDLILIASRHERGRVLQMNVPLDADWSTLPTRQDFVPLLHEMVLWLATPAESMASLASATIASSPAELRRAADFRAEADVAAISSANRTALEKTGLMDFFAPEDAPLKHWLRAKQPEEFWRAMLLAALMLLVIESLLTRKHSRAAPRDLGAETPVRGRTGVGLLLLRVGAVALLGVVWFEPVYRWSTQSPAGHIVVAVDVSESMDTPDTLSILDDQSPAPSDAPSRREMAARLIASASTSWLHDLPPSVQVEYLAFAGGHDVIDVRQLNTLSDKPLGNMLPQASDLAGALRAALASPSDSIVTDDPPLAVILCTDGQVTEQYDTMLAAEMLAEQSARVFPVLIGSPSAPRDLAVVSVDAPQRVFAGESARITAHLQTQGYEGSDVHVTVTSQGKTVATQHVTPKNSAIVLNFDLPTPASAPAAGRQDYVLRISAAKIDQGDRDKGETRADNNEYSFRIQATDDKACVMMLEGEARWEFRFLDGALGRDEHIEWKPIVFRQPYLGVLPETFYARRLDLPEKGARGDSPFADVDLVMLGDISPADLPARGWEFLEEFVAEQGGTLVVISGKQHFPQALDSPIAKLLLPVANLRPVAFPDVPELQDARNREFQLQLTSACDDEAAFHLAADSARNRAIWAELPGHSWGLTGDPKPGAWVLANAHRPTSQPDAAGPSQPIPDAVVRSQPIIVAQHYGLGHVVWLGIDSTWRWRRRYDETYYHRFWSQIVRAAARYKAAVGSGDVRFGPVAAEVEVGDEVVIRAQVSSTLTRQLRSVPLRAEILKAPAGLPVRTWDLEPLDSQSQTFEARGRSLPEGDYLVRLATEEAGRKIEQRPMLPEQTAPLRVRAARSNESLVLAADEDFLQQIAAAGNGELLRPDELSRLAALIPAPTANKAIEHEFVIWNHASILILLFALLAAEWGLRKRAGLP